MNRSNGGQSASFAGQALRGATYGICVWCIYWVAETLFSSILPRVLIPGRVLASSHVTAIGLLLGSYVLAGSVLGAAAGGLLAVVARIWPGGIRDPDRWLRTAATMTVVASLLVPALSDPVRLALLWTALAIGLTVAAAAAFATFAGGPLERLSAALINPWTVCFGLLGLLALREYLDDRPIWMSGAAALIFCAALTATAGLLVRRHLPQTIPLALALAGCLAFTGLWDRWYHRPLPADPPASAGGLPNIVLVVMDTVRADHLSLYGYERDTTPYLRELAAQAVVYRRALSTSDLTLTSMASLFTGQYPSWHGVYCDAARGKPLGRPIRAETGTLAEQLSRRGYQTLGIVSNYGYISPAYGMDRGFDYYSSPMPVQVLDRSRIHRLRRLARKVLNRFLSTAEFDRRYRNAEDINREVLRVLRDSDPEHPLFLFVNYMDAHNPYIPPAPYDRLFPGKIAGFTATDHRAIAREVESLSRKITPAERAHLVSQYDGGIASQDAAIREILAFVDQIAGSRETAVIVTADHGEAFGTKNIMMHDRTSLYQRQVAIPLIIKAPGVAASVVSDRNVSLVDVYATVMGMIGEESPASVQGSNLLSDPPTDRLVLAEAWRPGRRRHNERRPWLSGSHRKATFWQDWKLIAAPTGYVELYNLADDPAENDNLYTRDNPVGQRLLGALDEWTAVAPRPDTRSEPPDPETLRRLQSLGYIR